MKDSLVQTGRRKDASLLREQMEAEIGSFQYLTDGDAYQGIEFLNDAIRMEDQAFESTDKTKVSN
jgi:hypothetical protein